MARKPEVRGEDRPPTQGQIAETTPGYAGVVNEMWLAETVMQMQKALGELTSSATHLKETVDKQGNKLDRISHRVYAAGVVITILLAVVGFFLNKIWDGVFALLKAAH